MKLSKFSIITIALGFAVVAGVSAQSSATISLSGIVPTIFNTSIVEGSGLTDLDFTESNDVVVATLSIFSNNRNGYQVSIYSKNGLDNLTTPFFQAEGATDTIPYSLTYDGTDLSFASGKVIFNRTSNTLKDGDVQELVMSYTEDTLPYAGTYSDTIQIDITMN